MIFLVIGLLYLDISCSSLWDYVFAYLWVFQCYLNLYSVLFIVDIIQIRITIREIILYTIFTNMKTFKGILKVLLRDCDSQYFLTLIIRSLNKVC